MEKMTENFFKAKIKLTKKETLSKHIQETLTGEKEPAC